MLNDLERQTEGQKLLKQLREEYGRLQPQIGSTSDSTQAATASESHLELIPVQ
jgi:hypothetical protein